MAIARATLTTGSNGTATSTPVTASISPAPYSLVLVAVLTLDTTPPSVTSVSGLGLTWTQRVTKLQSSQRVYWFSAQCGPSPGSGALTLTLNASTGIGNALWDVQQVTGHDFANPIPQSAVNGSAGNTSLTLTLPNPSLNTASRHFAVYGHFGFAGTPGANYTEISDYQDPTSLATIETIWRSDAFQAASSATSASAQQVGAAIEVAGFDPLAISRVSLTTGSSGASASAVSTASISPVPNSLLAVAVSLNNDAAPPTATISGLGLTWTTRVDVTDTLPRQRLYWFTAQCGGSPGSGTLTFTPSGSTEFIWDVEQITGHNQSNPVPQTATNVGTNVALSVALAGAPASTASRHLSAWMTSGFSLNPTATGFVELSDQAPRLYLETQWRPDAFAAVSSVGLNGGRTTAGAIEIAADPGVTLVSGSDTGTFADAESLAVTLTGADTGSFIDAESLAVQVTDGETIQFLEGELLDVHPFSVGDADAASFGEGEALTVDLVQDDTGTFVEAESIVQQYFDGDYAYSFEDESLVASAIDDDPVSVVESELVQRFRPVFYPPTVDEGGTFGTSHPLWARIRLTAGVTVAFKDGQVFELQHPAQEELATYDTVYQGGRVYPLNDVEAAALAAAGYTITWDEY